MSLPHYWATLGAAPITESGAVRDSRMRTAPGGTGIVSGDASIHGQLT